MSITTELIWYFRWRRQLKELDESMRRDMFSGQMDGTDSLTDDEIEAAMEVIAVPDLVFVDDGGDVEVYDGHETCIHPRMGLHDTAHKKPLATAHGIWELKDRIPKMLAEMDRRRKEAANG